MLAFTSVSGGSAQTQSLDGFGDGREYPSRPSKSVESPFKEAYTERRWVGLRRKGIDHCPKVTGWVSETLQDRVLRRANVNRIVLHELELERYCIYTPDDGPWVDFQQPSGLVEASKDRLALSTTSAGGVSSDILSQKIWRDLARHFRVQTGQEASGQSAPLLLLKGESNVRLTFIDGQPDGENHFSKPSEGASLHGFTLVRLAQDMLCPSPGPCPVTIATRRALSYRDFDPQEELPPNPVKDNQSGHVGLVSDLATAIYAEVLYWRQHEPEKKLILNLSLGWDGEGFRDLDARTVSQLEPSVQTVYNALRFARKSGALVIAAAGNQRGSDNTKWPLLPAAWELRRPNWFRWAFFHKPVYAVGGVDWQGVPLPNSRKGGSPRRVAYADHSVTFADALDDPTAIYTGTSVSAAVASSIAAAVWHLRPELRPAQVMRLMLRSGDKLGARANFYGWKRPVLIAKLVDAPRTRRLSLCSAVARACGPDGSWCPALSSAPACPQWAAKPPELWKAIQELPPRTVYSASKLLASSALDGFIDAASQRWLIPQPENDPCPGCTLVPKEPPNSQTPEDPKFYKLELVISPEWVAKNPDIKIEKADLIIERLVDGIVKDEDPYPLSFTTLEPGKPYTFTDLGDGQSLLGCRAEIIFTATKNNVPIPPIVNPVTIVP